MKNFRWATIEPIKTKFPKLSNIAELYSKSPCPYMLSTMETSNYIPKPRTVSAVHTATYGEKSEVTHFGN